MKKIVLTVLLLFSFIAVIFLLYFINILPHKKYTNQDFDISTYQSKVDKDMDGIDDQTDILNNANRYIATRPKYKSKYYATGYPDDEYGVCTDVVAFSLLEAGYDLMELVYEDMKQYSDRYSVTVIDKNIDFRRVKNLEIYFRTHGISLTTDLSKIEEWQGGDIVIFKNHIGIISDKRNKRGIPFVIHHERRHQLNYEEDILELRKDVVGHYRVS